MYVGVIVGSGFSISFVQMNVKVVLTLVIHSQTKNNWH